MTYRVFTRTWWRMENGVKVPHIGRRTILRDRVYSEEDARAICDAWNNSHDPGPLSRKAEYERI